MVIVLLEHGFKVTIFDDLSNACEQVYPRLQVIAGDKAADMRFIKVISSIEVLIHFAGPPPRIFDCHPAHV